MGVMKTVLRRMSSLLPLAIGHMLDEDVGDVVAELASDERVDGGACLSWFCCKTGSSLIRADVTNMLVGYR